jgi:GTP cyclohydrolase III
VKWRELSKRTFAVDVMRCEECGYTPAGAVRKLRGTESRRGRVEDAQSQEPVYTKRDKEPGEG